jgi:hypothetical protein
MPWRKLTSTLPTCVFRLAAVSVGVLAFSGHPAAAQPWHFTDVTAAAGVLYQPGYDPAVETPPRVMAGGATAGDYDGDGWIDIYAIRGDIGPNLLFRNRGDGTFEEVAESAGLTVRSGSGPTFADIDGDGRLDLIVGGIDGGLTRLFRNLDGKRFTEVGSGFAAADVYSTALGDYDRDGDLDLATAHWDSFHHARLWRNDGSFVFTEVTDAAGLATPDRSYSFTPNFTDVNNDRWPDLLVSGDFGTSQYYLNNRNGTFQRATTAVITDENGMGSAIGDYDNDGDLDWFVSSIFSLNPSGWGITGNRLYRNRGDGTFDDATDVAGVRRGFWGWGSSFADVNNDGHLDLFHVNGFPAEPAAEFHADPARLFVSNGNGTFSQRAEELGIADTGQGRGVISFDFDKDGDLDFFLTNMLLMEQSGRLYRNDGGNVSNYLSVQLAGAPPNTGAIGAKIFVTVNGVTQMRELHAGSNFVSSDPIVAFFGLGAASIVDELRVVWPDGSVTRRFAVAANQALVISPQGGEPSVNVPTLDGVALMLLAVGLAAGALIVLRR